MEQHCRRPGGWSGVRIKGMMPCGGWRARRGQVTQDPVGGLEEPGFYSQWHEKPLEGFEQ